MSIWSFDSIFTKGAISFSIAPDSVERFHMPDNPPHKHRQSVTALVVTTLVLLFLAVSCSSKDDAAAIRKLIDKGAGLAAEKQIGDLMRLTADGFIADPGAHDAKRVKGILFIAFQHYGHFDIRYPRPAVDLEEDGKKAKATVYFVIVSKDKEIPSLKELYNNPREWIEAASEKADLYELKLDLVIDSGDWLIQRAAIEGFKGYGF